LKRATPIAAWLACLGACAWILGTRTSVTADLTAFLPRAATPAQEILVSQLRDGVAARLILVAVEGADVTALAATSQALAKRLRASGRFTYVANGASALASEDRDALFAHRYLLSPEVTAARFTEQGLHAALERSLALFASPLGPLIRPILPHDPTGELAALLAPHMQRPQPALSHGVWVDASQRRALLMAETRAPGYDLDAQAEAQAAISAAVAQTRTSPAIRVMMSGPAVFAVQSRATIRADVWWLTIVAGLGVTLLLLAAYRRISLVAFGALSVATGISVGIAVVSLGFGIVHAITLGFGATLVGEAVDYPTFLVAHRAPGEPLATTASRIWPTLRLAMFTTVFGSLAMLLSSFVGLAQLGLFSLAGVLTAGLVTRYVIPALASARPDARPAPLVRAAPVIGHILERARVLAPVVPATFLAAAIVIALEHATLWENDLANLSPIPAAAKRRDQELRDALGAPDVRQIVAVRGNSAEEVLQHLERLEPMLTRLVESGAIRSYDTAARYLPSAATQRSRQAALPEADELARRLGRATRGLPFRDGLFEPFLDDVSRARTAPPVTPGDFADSAWGLAIRSLLVAQGGGWVGLAPLAGVADPRAVQAAVAALNDPAVLALDLKAESEDMVRTYREQALGLASLGVCAIAAVLALGLRRLRRVSDVMIPVLAAIAATAAIFALAGVRLSLLHIVSLLLVLGIGVNYSLFFNRVTADTADRLRSTYSVVVANLTTLIAFGALATSGTPILQAIGRTVVLGAALSLVFAAAWARPQNPSQ
jgi:predicted exporter